MSTNRFRVRASSFVLSACASVLALPASAQQFPSCPLTANGADVICGDVSNAQNYNVAGSMDAVALGTTSCNVGTAQLNWIANTVNHPLMGGQMYKYTSANLGGYGRFESLGQSWLKHASTALQGSLCCSNCQSSGTGTRLGVGCSDPYGGSLNGSQGSLGPKYQVNAHTGTYTVPPTHPTGGNNGRIQMALTDLETNTADVRYFGEMTYVALDDAQANNSDNNISYREFSCAVGTSSAGFNFTALGVTTRMQPGLRAWQLVDPAVAITDIVTPEDSSAPYDGDARLVLGSRVTDLGNGTWHYEYALFNQNSDRAVAAFSVPISPNMAITNVGFHDVPYIGGDGIGGVDYDGTDWTASASSYLFTWQTLPYADNPNSNALRWECTYNFRFDANAPPTTGTVVIGQYKVVHDIFVSGIEVPGLPPAFDSFCSNSTFGVDHTTPCPCGNAGAPGSGCGHSFDPNGALLSASGDPDLDTVVLQSQFTPASSFTLFLQHTAPGDYIFHDGVLCAGGSLIRLRGRAAVAGAATFPNSAFAQDSTTTLSQRGSVTIGSGARRYYSAWFRNASSTFCPPATANVSNGWMIDW